MIELGVMLCLCPDVGCWVVLFLGPEMWGVLLLVCCLMWPVPGMWAIGSCLSCAFPPWLFEFGVLVALLCLGLWEALRFVVLFPSLV